MLNSGVIQSMKNEQDVKWDVRIITLNTLSFPSISCEQLPVVSCSEPVCTLAGPPYWGDVYRCRARVKQSQ